MPFPVSCGRMDEMPIEIYRMQVRGATCIVTINEGLPDASGRLKTRASR